MVMAGRLRGELAIAAANGLYLVLLLLGGMAFPLTELPAAVRSVAELLPAAALSEAVGAATDGGWAAARWWLTLAAWAVAAPAAAARTFRWE
jgi:ABC-2 type transport system permease protein